MRIAICDDNKDDIVFLEEIIKLHNKAPKIKISSYLSSTDLLVHLKEGITYDVIFLDIEMPDMTGLELGNSAKAIDPGINIVFVTNYTQYAIKAFDCNAFHYLTKPLDKEKVLEVLTALIESWQRSNMTYSIKTKSGYMSIPIKDLYYVECFKKHVIFHMENTIFEVPGRISEVYSFLKDYDFCQVHQGYIVNLKKIVNIDRLNIYLDNGELVSISQRKKADVFTRYAEFLGGKLQ